MDYQAFTNAMMYEGVRGALAADDALKQQGQETRFRVRETPEWKKHAGALEAEMLIAALITAVALAAPRAALADDAVAGAIVGAITGAAIATGAVVPYERREPLREYIVRESRPSYHYDEEVVVGRELPPGAYESYEVPEEYVPRGHHYAIVNDRPVIFHSETRRIIHVYE